VIVSSAVPRRRTEQDDFLRRQDGSEINIPEAEAVNRMKDLIRDPQMV